MAYITNTSIPSGNPTDVDTTAKYPMLTQVKDSDGNTLIYLTGVASVVLGTFVTYDELGITTRLAANAIGPVAIALAATVASRYGFFLIEGSGLGNVSAAFADNGNVYATATAGEVDDAVVAGDRVKNCIGRSAIASGKATMQVHSPYMDDGLSA